MPTTCDNNKKVFQLRKEVTALVASFGVHTTIIKACSQRNRLGHRDMGCAGMSKAAKNSGTGLILTEDEGVLRDGRVYSMFRDGLCEVWLPQRQKGMSDERVQVLGSS